MAHLHSRGAGRRSRHWRHSRQVANGPGCKARAAPGRDPALLEEPGDRRAYAKYVEGVRPSATQQAGSFPAPQQAGYNLVILIMLMTVMGILLAAALPMWSTAIKRDKEEELISRGWQYAEAIRVFQRRYQRLPVTLEELAKVRPRCIRQQWKDPMTKDGNWRLIPLHGEGTRFVQPQSPGADKEGPSRSATPESGKQVVSVGPFIGVASRSEESSELVFFGQTRYDAWEFTVTRLSGGGGLPNPLPPAPPPKNPPPGGNRGGTGAPAGWGTVTPVRGGAGVPGVGPGPLPPGAVRTGGLVLSARWLGRPFPNFAPVGATLPGQSGAGSGSSPTKPTKPGSPPG
ncbi:MAG TPA: type II secretion system protein [Thermoanaerobaculia bacterium]|nr:type II secretion system protein [Thermoanaerobaculia bacterium]